MTYLCYFLWREINLKRSIRIMFFWRTHVQHQLCSCEIGGIDLTCQVTHTVFPTNNEWTSKGLTCLSYLIFHVLLMGNSSGEYRFGTWETTRGLCPTVSPLRPLFPPVGQAATRSISDKVDLEATTADYRDLSMKWLGAPLNVHTCSYIIFNYQLEFDFMYTCVYI